MQFLKASYLADVGLIGYRQGFLEEQNQYIYCRRAFIRLAYPVGLGTQQWLSVYWRG